MDPNSSLGKICLGENVVVISSDKVEGSGDWNSPKFQDIANSGQKKETKAMVFYQMDTEEVSDRFVAPCFVNRLEAYDGEIDLGVEENMNSTNMQGEIYFVKFIINPEEDDVEPRVIFRRSFLRMTKANTDFGAGTITIYPDIDPFLEETKEEEKINDDWDHFLDFNLDDVPVLGTSSSAGGHLTQEEAAKEALAIRMSQKFALLEEERPIIEIMAYHDKYKKILDEVGVTTLIAKFIILDIPIDRDAPIVVGRGFLCTIGGIVNTPERLFSTFNGVCHQTFRAARSDVMRNTESDSDDEEEYQIQRNNVWKKAVSFLGSLPLPLKHINWKPDYNGSYTKEEEETGQWRTKIRLTDLYGNIYLQGFTTKKTDRKLSKYHKLSDIMSPN
ncbi:hypothetical protein Tco_1281392 [Tanacetum coccineum]